MLEGKFMVAFIVCILCLLAPLLNAQYFVPVWEGNGWNHMNFYVYSATVNDYELTAGDEIAVFDGEVCVGAIVLQSPISQYPDHIVPLIVSMNDATTPDIDGYTPGNSATFKVWDAYSQNEYSEPDLVVDFIMGGPTFVVGGSSFLTIDFFQETVLEPQFFPEPGDYNNTVFVEILCESENALIYYTVDGTDPDVNSLQYEAAIQIDDSTTFRARAFKEGYLPSSIVIASYTISLSIDDLTEEILANNVSMYPNPFNPESIVRYELKHDERVASIAVYNVMGKRVRLLRTGSHRGGEYSIRWDGFDDSGVPLSSGIYIVTLKTDNDRVAQKITLLK